MLRLKIVKSAAAEQEAAPLANHGSLLHGTLVLKELVMPWAMTDRIVCADSFFASVGAAVELKRLGFVPQPAGDGRSC